MKLVKPLIIFISFFLFSIDVIQAHQMKPALVDIKFYQNGKVDLLIETNLEAILANISPQHNDTDDAPQSAIYQDLRKLPPEQLAALFKKSEKNISDNLYLSINPEQSNHQIKWTLDKLSIPQTGDIRLSRQSVIKYSAHIDIQAHNAVWKYPQQYGDNIVRFSVEGKPDKTGFFLTKGRQSPVFSLGQLQLKQNFWQIFKHYTILGFEHILPKGVDHILFVLGLFLLSTKLSSLLWQVTFFTLAHSITLGLSMINIISLSASIVEPLIALSIVYVGVENILVKELKKSRLFIVFVFGLLHGLGFASVLAELGMPDSGFFSALLSFNLGVELGQVSVILLAMMLTYPILSYLKKYPDSQQKYRNYMVIPLSLMISLIAAFWFFERI